MVRVSQESQDTQTRGVEAEELYPSRDCPGMVRISQESRDTQTRGVEAGELYPSLYPSRDCPEMVRVSQESRDTQTRGGRGRRAVSIPGLCWDGQSIPGIPGYSDKGG